MGTRPNSENDNTFNENDLYEGSDSSQDTEPEYEETFVFEWELT